MGGLVRRLCILCAALGLGASLATQAEAPQAGDWASIATDDLHFVRAALRTNHPGAVDSENPAFRDWFDRGFEQASKRAARARDYPGYFFAIQYYLNGFQDGHLGALDRDARLPTRWPGFTVGFRDGGFFVKETSEDGPSTGDRLVACDGRSADAWADAIIRDYVGPWSIRGARPRYAPWLMIDEGNPFVRPPRRCEFRGADGSVQSRELAWRAIGFDDLNAKIEAAQDHFQPPFAVRSFGAGGWWISVPSFDAGSPDTVAALSRLIAEVEAKADEIRSARLLVLDVRGNHGGDSNYGLRIAAALWGEAYVAAMKPRPAATDWRVSDENLRALKYFLKREQEQFGESSDAVRALAAVVSGMEAAAAQHMTWYRETEPAPPAGVMSAPMPVRVYFLTDYACFSACLDFADLVIHIPGVVHVGQETSADAVYIDNNALRMPSGNGWLGYSMKVHRGRTRGNNESYQPALAWQGSMEDTDAIEAWIGGLAGDAPDR